MGGETLGLENAGVKVVAFNDFDKKSSDFYNLKKLNPAYHVYFGENDFIAIPDELEKICKVFEKEEKGSSVELLKFMMKQFIVTTKLFTINELLKI